MKRLFTLFISIVFILIMTACQPFVVSANIADSTDTAVKDMPSSETLQAVAMAENYKLTIDVNPSVELTVQNGLVTGAVAYNDDGQAILLSANVTGLSVEGAIDTIITEIAGAGYLNTADKEPYVLLTLAGGEAGSVLNEELREYTEKALEEAGVDCEVKSVAVSGDIVDGAITEGMSAGRYMVLQYIAKEKGITFEEAAALYGTMSIGQLMEQFGDIEEAFDEDGIGDIEDIDNGDEENNDNEDLNNDNDEADATSGATINPNGTGNGGQTGENGQVSGDDNNENGNENDDQDDDQNDDQDDDNDDGNGGGDDQGEDD